MPTLRNVILYLTSFIPHLDIRQKENFFTYIYTVQTVEQYRLNRNINCEKDRMKMPPTEYEQTKRIITKKFLEFILDFSRNIVDLSLFRIGNFLE